MAIFSRFGFCNLFLELHSNNVNCEARLNASFLMFNCMKTKYHFLKTSRHEHDRVASNHLCVDVCIYLQLMIGIS